MAFEQILFYIASLMVVFAAFRVITVRNPVHAALYLVLTFFTTSIIWMLLEAEFLAITLVLVYVGAVMVLFLFVVMMLDIDLVPLREGFIKFLPIGIMVALVVIGMLVMVVGPDQFGLEHMAAPERHGPEYSNTKELGAVLYTVYVYPFEIAAVILLVAIIAAISLTLRRRMGVKPQDVAKQVRVSRDDRLRVVKMKSE